MSRYARRRDTTHAPMVADLRTVGADVLDLAMLGNDAPDLLVCQRGLCVLVEVKSRKRIGKYKGDGRSDGQIDFAKNWRGCQVIRAETAEEVLNVLRAA
jgi:hypothetical protein